MSHYKTNLRDLEFLLFDSLARQSPRIRHLTPEIDGDTARTILAEVDRLAAEAPGPLLRSTPTGTHPSTTWPPPP